MIGDMQASESLHCGLQCAHWLLFASGKHAVLFCTGENWTAAKKASDQSTSRLPSLSDFNSSVNPASAVNALNGVFKRLLTLGDLNLANYAAGMPALYGTSNSYGNGSGNWKINGASLPNMEKVQGLQRKMNGVSKESVQVNMPWLHFNIDLTTGLQDTQVF